MQKAEIIHMFQGVRCPALGSFPPIMNQWVAIRVPHAHQSIPTIVRIASAANLCRLAPLV